MNCSSCGSNLPPGAATCPVCGVPTPYNVGQAQYQPTIPASPYSAPNDPTYISSPYGTPPPSQQPIPSTSYGSSPYGPAQQNLYGPPSNPYGVTDPYSAPAAPPPSVYPGGYPPSGQPPKRRSRVGLIIGIVLLVLVLACAGIIALVTSAARNVVSNASATLTATVPSPIATTPAPQSASPSGSPIVPSASTVLNNLKMASSIDSNFNPTNLTTTFTTNQKVYVTYSINTGGKSGYARSKWYINGKLDFTSPILTIKPDYDHGFFRDTFGSAGTGTVELYWCTQSDCSDAQLASFTTFTINAASSHTTGQPAVAMMDMDRRV